MRFVIDCNSGRKLQFLQPPMLDFATRLFQQWRKLKRLNFERLSQRVFHQGAVQCLRYRTPFHIAYAKNGENRVVFARKNVCAQNIQRNNRKRSRDLRQKMRTIPRAKRSDTVSDLWNRFPVRRRHEGSIELSRGIREE